MIKQIFKIVVPRRIIAWGLNTHEHQVALTFDDGPHPVNTPQIIEILEKQNVKATFFMLGKQMEKYKNIVRIVSQKGHVIANHGYSHKLITKHDLKDEIERTERIIVEITGGSERMFRPPYGALSPSVLFYTIKMGLKTVLWSLDSQDFHEKTTSGLRVNMERTKSGDIILMHDDYDHTVKSLPALIKDIRSRGFEFVTVKGSK